MLVVLKIQDPRTSVGLPLAGELASSFNRVAAQLSKCDRIARGLVAAFQGDFAAATSELQYRQTGATCGNARAAEGFGSAEALASIAFLRSLYDVTSALQLAPDPVSTLESVNVRSTRWALVYAMRACANEQLGHTATAVADSCIAAEQARKPDESWSYYYPLDLDIWTEITIAVREVRERVGGTCTMR